MFELTTVLAHDDTVHGVTLGADSRLAPADRCVGVVVKFFVVRLLDEPPDPVTGPRASASTVLGEALREAPIFEDLGFDAYGIGEHHIDDAEASSPPVLLGHIAARTTRLRLFTGVTVLPLLDPVRVAEDYATLDVDLRRARRDHHRQGQHRGAVPRLRLHQRRPVGPQRREVRAAAPPAPRGGRDVGRARTARRSSASRRGPGPLQDPIRIWHGSATSTRSTELAARWGDPLFSANVSGPLEQYRALVDDYRRALGGPRPRPGRRPSSAPARPGSTCTPTRSGGRGVPPELRGVPGLRPGQRPAAAVHVAGGRHRPRLVLRRQPAAGARAVPPLPRRVRPRDPARRQHRQPRRPGAPPQHRAVRRRGAARAARRRSPTASGTARPTPPLAA